MGRRTALRHDLFNPQRRSDRNYRPDERFDFEDDEIPSIPRRSSRRRDLPGCGSDYGSRCGLWG